MKFKSAIFEVANGTPAALPNKALERNVCSLMKRTIATSTGVGGTDMCNVSLIGRSRVSALYQRRVGDA